MDNLFTAGILLPLFAILWVLGWLTVIVNGRRPVHMRFKGLGLEIQINPCGAATSCPLSHVKE